MTEDDVESRKRAVGRQLYIAAIAAGLETKEQVAVEMQKLGVKVDAVSVWRWWRGKHVPSMEALIAYARLTGRTVASFFEWNGEEMPRDTPALALAFVEILLIAHRLPDLRRQADAEAGGDYATAPPDRQREIALRLIDAAIAAQARLVAE